MVGRCRLESERGAEFAAMTTPITATTAASGATMWYRIVFMRLHYHLQNPADPTGWRDDELAYSVV